MKSLLEIIKKTNEWKSETKKFMTGFFSHLKNEYHPSKGDYAMVAGVSLATIAVTYLSTITDPSFISNLNEIDVMVGQNTSCYFVLPFSYIFTASTASSTLLLLKELGKFTITGTNNRA